MMGKGMTAKKKSNHKKPITVTRAFVDKTKRQITNDVTVMMLACCMDEMDWTREDVIAFRDRFERYQNAVDEHLITVHRVAEIMNHEIDVRVGVNV